MGKNHYIAGCVFTSRYQKLSELIRKYVRERHGMDIVRCCVPNYKIKEFNNLMGDTRESWELLPQSADFAPGYTVYGICPNCSAILEETKPEVELRSLWELILDDGDFPYPDYNGETVSIQDCWRYRDRREVQNAARRLLENMNFRVLELEENHENTEFCGVSLLRPSPPRNLELAPKRFVEKAKGKFVPHDKESQKRIMEAHRRLIPTERVVAYCHYCAEGLAIGGSDTRHLAELLFGSNPWH